MEGENTGEGEKIQFEELRFVCEEAARDVVSKKGRPVPPTVVLPAPERTRLLTLPAFPDDDRERHDYLATFAYDEITAKQAPAWGFVAEGEVDGADVVVIVYGARQHAPHISAAPFAEDGGLEEFLPGEELDPTALPFLHPLQHAVDSLPPLDEGDTGAGGLPMFGG